jgi:hypothetical protein
MKTSMNTDELKKEIRAECVSCKTLDSLFVYVGINKLAFESDLGMDFFKERYGKGIFFLYNCENCHSSQTLASLRPYPSDISE